MLETTAVCMLRPIPGGVVFFPNCYPCLWAKYGHFQKDTNESSLGFSNMSSLVWGCHEIYARLGSTQLRIRQDMQRCQLSRRPPEISSPSRGGRGLCRSNRWTAGTVGGRDGVFVSCFQSLLAYRLRSLIQAVFSQLFRICFPFFASLRYDTHLCTPSLLLCGRPAR